MADYFPPPTSRVDFGGVNLICDRTNATLALPNAQTNEDANYVDRTRSAL